MSAGVGVRPQEEVVLILRRTHHQVQVAALEETVEAQANVARIHALEGPGLLLLLKVELAHVLRHVLASHPALQTVLVLHLLVVGERVGIARTQVDDAGGLEAVVAQQLGDQRGSVLDEDGGWYFEILGLPASGEVGDQRVELGAFGRIASTQGLGGLFAAVEVLHFL